MFEVVDLSQNFLKITHSLRPAANQVRISSRGAVCNSLLILVNL